MKISSKVRNGVAAMIYIAKHTENSDEKVSLLSISNSFDISKIYLEQAFVLLKKENLVISTKGPKGGYTLSRPSDKITLYDILFALDSTIFEKTEKTIEKDNSIEKIMHKCIFTKIDESLKSTLTAVTLEDILEELRNEKDDYFMYYL